MERRPLVHFLRFDELAAHGVPYGRDYLRILSAKGLFPRPIKLSTRRTVWQAHEVDNWVRQRIAERDNAARQDAA